MRNGGSKPLKATVHCKTRTHETEAQAGLLTGLNGSRVDEEVLQMHDSLKCSDTTCEMHQKQRLMSVIITAAEEKKPK